MSDNKPINLNIRYYKHALILNNELTTSIKPFIAITTFWTQKDEIWQSLNQESKNKVSVVGQLYTFNGLEWIERNCLANPSIKVIIITGYDNNNIKCKIESHTSVMSDYVEYENIFWNRYNQTDKTLIFIDDYKTLNNIIQQLDISTYTNDNVDPVIVPPPIKSEFVTYESEESGFIVRDDDLYRLWKRSLTLIKLFGILTNGTCEILNLVEVLTRKPILHPDMPAIEQIDQYLPQVCSPIPTKGLTYTYGSRLHDREQINNCIRLLSENVLNRQACITTWLPPDDYHHPPPCLVLVTFRIHPIKTNDNNDNNELFGFYMNTTFRSHDIYKAFCMNIYALWSLGEKVLNEVMKKTNKTIKFMSLTNNSIAAHVYENDFKHLTNINMLNCSLDHRGYFIISLDDKNILVQLMNTNNELVTEFKSNDPHELSDKCQPFISEVSHALYIGRELMKAKYCLDNNLPYTQD